jgi:hypothetical protein
MSRVRDTRIAGYEPLLELSNELAVIREKLKAVPDHEQRIRRLEASRAKQIGAAITVSATAGSLGTWLTLVVVHH